MLKRKILFFKNAKGILKSKLFIQLFILGFVVYSFPQIARADAELYFTPKAGYATLQGYDSSSLKTLTVSTTYVTGAEVMLDSDLGDRTDGWIRLALDYYQFYPPPNYTITNPTFYQYEAGLGLGYAFARSFEGLIEANYTPVVLLTTTGNSSSAISNPFWYGVQPGIRWLLFRLGKIPFKLQADFAYLIPIQSNDYTGKLNFKYTFSANTSFYLGHQNVSVTAYYSQVQVQSNQISYMQGNYEMGLKLGFSFHIGEGLSGSGGVKGTGGGNYNACPSWCEREHL